MTANLAKAPSSAVIIPDAEREKVLPTYLGKHFAKFENAVYRFSDMYGKNYKGGFWDFFKVPNSMFMALASQCEIEVTSAHMGSFDGVVSSQAFGIIVCICAYAYVLELDPENRAVYDLYWALRNFAAEHPEVAAITRAID